MQAVGATSGPVQGRYRLAGAHSQAQPPRAGHELGPALLQSGELASQPFHLAVDVRELGGNLPVLQAPLAVLGPHELLQL